MGAITLPLYSYLDDDSPKDFRGASVTPPSKPSAANGSIRSGTAAGAGGAAAGAGGAAKSSSSLTVSTAGGGADAGAGADAAEAVASARLGVVAKISKAGAAGAAVDGLGSKDPKSRRSISGGGAGAATGGAATGGATGGAARGGVGAGAGGGGGGGAPGTMPPNKAAAMRSFSNCSGVFCAMGGGAGEPKPPYPEEEAPKPP